MTLVKISAFQMIQSSILKLIDIREAFHRILMVSCIITFLAMAFVGTFVTLRETHRAIGPARKMQKKFIEMTQGDFSKMIPFRSSDVLKGLDNLDDFFTAYDKVMREIDPLLKDLERGSGDARDNLLKVRGLLAGLDQQMDAFRSK